MKTDISQLSQLQKFIEEFIHQIQAGDVIYLQGDLGTGKTTFTQMLLKQMGYHKRVKSPTYAIYECYQLPIANVYHLDLYRLSNPEELYYLAIDEIFNNNNIVIVEWPEKGLGVLPNPTKTLQFDLTKDDFRQINLHIT